MPPGWRSNPPASKGNAELLGRTDMIVAAGGGERDYAVDSAILSAHGKAEKPDAFLNERLMSDLRPTLFLAQLSNLLAGNISIVHGVTGSSRTFMGEEAAGVDAVRVALARIDAGQSDIVLVGGSYNGERPDVLLLFEFGDYNLKGSYAPVWKRGPKGGLALGSLGAFLVIESRASAQARGAQAPRPPRPPCCRTAPAASPATSRPTLGRMWDEARRTPATAPRALGRHRGRARHRRERAFLARHPELAVRATGSYLGHADRAAVRR